MSKTNRPLIALLALSASGPIFAGGNPPDVLLLSDSGSEEQVAAALGAAGHTVAVTPYPTWDGLGLETISAVVFLDGVGYGLGLTEEADAALADFVAGGGRLVMTEWTCWDGYFDLSPQVTALMPVSTPDAAFGYGDTWTVSDPDHPLVAGLPASWTDPAGWTNAVAHPLATVVVTGAAGNALLSFRTDAGGAVIHVNHSMAYGANQIEPEALQLLVNAVEAPLSPPPCPSDLDGDGAAGVTDLLQLLQGWGPCLGCPADLDGDGEVGVTDLLQLLKGWGDCP